MYRRLFLATALCLPLTRPAWAEEPEAESEPGALPQYKVSAAALQAAVGQRFPLRYPVPGLLNLDVQLPQLRLLPRAKPAGRRDGGGGCRPRPQPQPSRHVGGGICAAL